MRSHELQWMLVFLTDDDLEAFECLGDCRVCFVLPVGCDFFAELALNIRVVCEDLERAGQARCRRLQLPSQRGTEGLEDAHVLGGEDESRYLAQ